MLNSVFGVLVKHINKVCNIFILLSKSFFKIEIDNIFQLHISMKTSIYSDMILNEIG
jgi:hypothetical protein